MSWLIKQFQAYWLGLLVLIVSISTTWGGFNYVYERDKAGSIAEFNRICEKSTERLQGKFEDYANLLGFGDSFFASSTYIDHMEWDTFVREAYVTNRYPGVWGFAFVQRVRADELDAFITKLKSDGMSDFQLKKPDDADIDAPQKEHYIIKYHAPDKNKSAIGFDLATRRVNRLAYDKAMQTGKVQLSDRITLVQGESRHGLVMVYPVYENGKAVDTDKDRISNLYGWVAIPIDIGTFYEAEHILDPMLAIELSETHTREPIYASSHGVDKSRSDLALSSRISFGGKMLDLKYWPAKAYMFKPDHAQAYTVLISGLLMSVLLTAVTMSLARTGVRAEGIARKLNVDLELAQERLMLAIKSSRIGLWDWHVPTGAVHYSDTMFEMLEYEVGDFQMTIESWKDLCHPEDLDAALADMNRHFAGDSDLYENEHRLRRKDGSWMWARDVGEVVERDHEGNPLRAIGVIIDIQKFREALDMAEAANLAKSEFLANMSHEIRTPMTAILGFADLLDEGSLKYDPKQSSEAVKTIRNNAKHLLTIINDILDMSKIEAGRMTVESIKMNPVQIVEEVASLMQPRAKGKGIDVVIRYETKMPVQIQSDPTRLRQILINLTSNAIKFTEVGQVTIYVSCDTENGRMVFRVEDTGIGMSPEQRDVVARFEAFSQADTSMTRKFGGTGLGLRISSALSRMLGGGIEVQSEVGKGSIFTASIATGDLVDVTMQAPETLSKLRLAEHNKVTQEIDKAKPLSGKRLLVAEDGIDNQRLISFHLKKAGAEVSLAENGLIAMQLIDEKPFDLVLMDMQMPELDGYGATQRLRHKGCDIPILALTAHAMASDRQKCLDHGCDDYLTKPIDKAKLIAMCLEWINARSNRACA